MNQYDTKGCYIMHLYITVLPHPPRLVVGGGFDPWASSMLFGRGIKFALYGEFLLHVYICVALI